MLQGSEVEIIDKEYNITPSFQKVYTDMSYNTAKSINYMEKKAFRDILQKTDFLKPLPTKGRMSGRDRYIKNDLNKEVGRLLILDTKFKGEGVEKIFIPSNINDIYTRLEILLGLKFSRHTDTLTEASNLINQLYKMGKIQNKQQYRNAFSKFSTL